MEYEKVGDYFIPKISVPKSKYKNVNLSKYGRAYLKYLKENMLSHTYLNLHF